MITAEHSGYRTGIGNLGELIVPHNADFYYEIGSGNSLIKRLMERLGRKKNKDIDA